jgi:hypothetical protein
VDRDILAYQAKLQFETLSNLPELRSCTNSCTAQLQDEFPIDRKAEHRPRIIHTTRMWIASQGKTQIKGVIWRGMP